MAPLSSVLVAVLGGVAYGQSTGWDPGQISASMCMWKEPRAAVLRDTVYLDGGFIYWTRGMSDGSVGPVFSDNDPYGLVYSLNFSLAFNTTQNLTALFQTKSKAAGGSGNANNIAPNYIDGGMLANDAQYYLYGGLVKQTDAFPEPHPDDVMGYQAYQYGPEKPTFQPGFIQGRLPDPLTRYVAYGASVNAPSENKAWYFSGLRSPTWGPIYRVSGNNSINAVNVSNTLISLDMQTQGQPKWSNITLPDDVKGRANAEVVWVPVGSQGILVVIGGVVFPEFATLRHASENPAASKAESDLFMKVIDIYDVASGNWYKQPTEGGPSALTRGCAVLAPAKDFSSFNIYYYGGYPGVDPKVDFSDDVWVLSLPSFTWTKVSEGSPDHGRAGHKCVMPYADQLMIIGGYTPTPGRNIACLKDGGIVQMFNLTSAKWMDGYDPQNYFDYGVPEAVLAKIGGGAVGAATATEPVPSGWATPELESIFATPYTTEKLRSWYPYPAATPTTRPTVPDDNDGGGGGGGVPSWVAPVLGVVLGLVFVTALLVAFCLWRRRKMIKRGGMSDASTDDNGMRILSWIRGQPSEPKAPTVSTDETPLSPDMAEVRPPASAVPTFRHEMPDTAIAELMDTSPRAELQDTGLSPVEIINKHSHFAPRSSTNPSSYYGSISGNEQASSVSRSSGALGAQSRVSFSEPNRAESPSLGSGSGSDAPQIGNGRVTSGVSGISEREAGHLRQISEATVSSASSGGEQEQPQTQLEPQRQLSLRGGGVSDSAPETPTPGGAPSPLSPGLVSPPTAGPREGDDYISARALPVSPAATTSLRKSVFHESEEDLGGHK